METNAELDPAQRKHVWIQPPAYGPSAASRGSIYAGFRHPPPVLPADTFGIRNQGGRLLQLRRQPRSVVPARRVPVQQQDQLDQRTSRDSVRIRARIPAV